MPDHERVILHMDMDAFYAAVEVRENPALAGKPVIIGHKARRGVVATCSYEARKFGVRSAMPALTAARLCPEAVWVHGRMDLYVEVSRRIRRILDEFTPLVEPLSIDEAFLDLTGIARDLDEGGRIGRRLKDRIRAEERLTTSVGVAPTKFLAKLASDLEKPDGLVVFRMEEIPGRLWPLPVEKLWGVGPKSAQKLRRGGLTTIGELARAGHDAVEGILGQAAASHLLSLAWGEDPREVSPEHEAKSISEERTYGEDLRDAEVIEAELLARSESLARQLREEGLSARTIRIKVRTGDFKTVLRSRTLPDPTDLAEGIYGTARDLYRSRIRLGRKGVRLLGVGVTGLEPPGGRQKRLFVDPSGERAGRAARAADSLIQRFGPEAVTRARLLARKRRRRRRADR